MHGGIQFLVFLLEPARVFSGVARAAAVCGRLAQSSLYLRFEPRAFDTGYRSSLCASFWRIATARSMSQFAAISKSRITTSAISEESSSRRSMTRCLDWASFCQTKC